MRYRRSPSTAPPKWLTRIELAKRLGLKPKTLANWASLGIGPKFTKGIGGRARYHIDDVERWEASL
ncbi:helix-turn-helix transcriptional regulator [Nocardia sp. alder85J]|uniref:helix-turn-helix transcriptional regulator n=1 Tax=Nocardia sp. alder85J TaxID=2862949 RepID=UPI001CD4013A|nr:helix-turn-helix domain-containing protein [Nocardia sp. alder85J]MCX4098320.1 helix-turn-helix domain-containing protein [Nocardia sp. alder85J]